MEYIYRDRPPGQGTREKKVDLHGVMRLIEHLTEHRGLWLTIHGMDGTVVQVYPKCIRCGCYNTFLPLDNGLCSECRNKGAR